MISLLVVVILSGTHCMCDERVRFAAVLYRHGDRTPVDTYPSDPWRNESLWPVRFGELTNTGKQQHYALGQWFRKRYSHLLSPYFDPTEIYVRSTDVDRTLMSAQANLAGMYPPVDKSVWNTNLMWQPIPVHTVPQREDEVVASKKPCPAFNQEYIKVTTSTAYKQRLKKYKKIMTYLSKYTGAEIKDYCTLLNIYSILYIESLYNLTLPEWTQKVFPDAMLEPAAYCFAVNTSTPVLARLNSGPLLKQIVKKMNNAMRDTKHPNVLIYSGHDLTVASILNAMGLYDFQCPTYTATVLFELVQVNATNYMRISYRNDVGIVEPTVLAIPGCGQLCPVDRFIQIYDNLLSVDWEYECEKQTTWEGAVVSLSCTNVLCCSPIHVTSDSNEFFQTRFPALLGVSFFIGLALFAAIYVAHKIHFARISRQHKLNMVYTSLPPATPTPTPTK